MCGIAGMSLAPGEKCYPTKVATAMLKAIAHRGPDATGAAWVAPNSMAVYFQKDAVPVHAFLPGFNLEGARTCILHTRYATQGDKAFEQNNHPIIVPGMVGIHNGCLRNDDAIFSLLDGVERYGQVDSEAAFALLNANLPDMSVLDRLTLLEGSAALAWLHVDDEGLSDRVLHLARVSSSPLWLGQTDKGSTLFASTKAAVQAGALAMGAQLPFLHEVAEGTYLRVRRGVIIEWSAIPMPKRAAAPAKAPKVSSAKKAADRYLTTTLGFGGNAERDAWDAEWEQEDALRDASRASGTWDRDWWAKRGRNGGK